MAAVYTLAQNMASLVQAPQRGVISSSLASLSQAWKDKNMGLIDKIYHRSSINQLIFATAMFSLVYLNFIDAVYTLHLNKVYLDAINVFLFIGLTKIVDMGTGVSGQIIGTSTKWRFDFLTGILLLLITLPLNYILTKKIGVTGPAIANLISFSVYNAIRYWFLAKKFNLQPFNSKSLLTLLLAAVTFTITYLLFNGKIGFEWLFIRSIVFLAIFISGSIALKLSPDILPVLQSIKKKLGLSK